MAAAGATAAVAGATAAAVFMVVAAVSTAADSPVAVLKAVVFTVALAAVFTIGSATGFTADTGFIIRTALGTAIIRTTATESPQPKLPNGPRIQTIGFVAGHRGFEVELHFGHGKQ